MDILGIISIPTWLLSIIAVIILLYIYGTWTYGFWESQHVKTIPPKPFIGSMSGAFSQVAAEMDLQHCKDYGKVYGYYEARQPYLMIHDLDMIKTILVKDFNYFVDRRIVPLGGKAKIANHFLTNLTGDAWRSARVVLSPTFTSGKLRQMAVLMEDSAHKMISILKDDIKKNINGDVNVKDRVGAYTMDVIASCCFGTVIDSHDPSEPFMKHAKNIFSPNVSVIMIMMILFPKLVKLFEWSMFPVESLEYFENAVRKVVQQRRSQKARRNDFLQLLMDAQDNEKQGKLLDDNDDDAFNKDEKPYENASTAWKTHKVLDETALVANSILFFLAGYDTTANTISYALYLLALNEECQIKLKEEIDQAIKEHGKLKAEVILSLPYLEMVISETLRMYPPAIRMERQCSRDYNLGDIFIPKGTLVAAGIYSIHYDPEIYPEPNKFQPERFTYENKVQRHPMSYLPFGAGPRICIGMRFALMETKICVAHFINNYKVSPCSKTEIPVEMKKAIPMLLPMNGITVKVELRI